MFNGLDRLFGLSNSRYKHEAQIKFYDLISDKNQRIKFYDLISLMVIVMKLMFYDFSYTCNWDDIKYIQ
jgi:hypothetical protein